MTLFIGTVVKAMSGPLEADEKQLVSKFICTGRSRMNLIHHVGIFLCSYTCVPTRDTSSNELKFHIWHAVLIMTRPPHVSLLLIMPCASLTEELHCGFFQNYILIWSLYDLSIIMTLLLSAVMDFVCVLKWKEDHFLARSLHVHRHSESYFFLSLEKEPSKPQSSVLYHFYN